jgi:hypothetical protein
MELHHFFLTAGQEFVSRQNSRMTQEYCNNGRSDAALISSRKGISSSSFCLSRLPFC